MRKCRGRARALAVPPLCEDALSASIEKPLGTGRRRIVQDRPAPRTPAPACVKERILMDTGTGFSFPTKMLDC